MKSANKDHFVSQCHQRKFFNSESRKIYYYDKTKEEHFFKQSPGSQLFGWGINQRTVNSEIDSKTLELELQKLFENDFNRNIEEIEKFVETQENLKEASESLAWLTLIGILGVARHPLYKEEIEKCEVEFQVDVISRIIGGEKASLTEYLNKKKQTPFFNTLGYVEIAVGILERLEPFDFELFYIKSDDSFILPDTSCFQIRGRLKDYPNPHIMEIIQLGIPLTDKLFLLATPKSLNIGVNRIRFIMEDNSEIVKMINKDLYDFAYEKVACKNERFLEEFVNTMHKK